MNTKRLQWIRRQQYSIVKNKHPTKQIKEKSCTNKERGKEM